MDTQVRTPQAIFMQPQRLLVPLFQRPYVWNEEKQWEPLWRDVERVANRFLATPHTFNQPHFLGAIVLQQMASQTSDLQQRTVIDGQQRLTTLQVLLDAIHSEIVLIGVKTPAARIEPLIENAEAFCKKPEDRFKVWPTNRDREAFNEVMAAPSPVQYDELDHKGHRLVRAHRYFAEQCRDWLAAKGAEHIAERAEGLERTARDLLQLVVIDLTANEDAQEIFETLNARGTPLTAADLIKNFVFQRLLEQGADVEAAYAHYWQQFETAFWEKEVSLGRTVYPRSSVFLNHWLISQTGEEIVAREVFSRFKTFVDYDAQKAMSELLKDIHRASEIYRQFIECSEVSEGAIDRIALFGYRSKTMESEVVKPVVLALLDHKNGKPSDSELNLALDTIESWLTRRMLVKATTKNYNTILTEVVNIVRQGDNSQPGKTIQSYFASQQSESGYWPDDQEVRNALLTLPIYRKISRSRLRMVLEAYEDHRRAWTPGKVSYAGVRIKRSAYAIEHLMPQSWHKHWKLNPSFTEDERERRIHCLGNLTLLSKRLNSKISNGPWPGKEGKVQSLIKNDVLLMNSELVNEHAKTWNELDIDTRTTQMIDSILQIWPVPEGHKSVIKRAAETGKSYVEVADLLADGLLQPGQILCSRPGKFGGHTAVVLSDGRLDYQGTVFDSPSAAGTAVRKRPTNGWIFWHLDEHGTKRLAHIRQEYRERLALESDESEEDEETD